MGMTTYATPMPKAENVRTVEWAMQVLGYECRESFLRFIREKRVPFYQLNKRVIRFDEPAVMAWLDQQRVGN